MADGKDFDSEFEVIRVRNTGSKNITDAVASKADGKIEIEKHVPKRAPLELIKRLFLSKKYNNNLVAIMTGGITVGGLATILSYANQYTKPFNEISGVVTELQNAIACGAKIFSLINQEKEIDVEESENQFRNIEAGRVDINDVAFSYVPDRKLIENLNLHVKPGQRIAIVGPTGCGKTTIINLLMRFYDVDKGSITIDGKDIRDISRKNLRSFYGMVLQETWLRNTTVRENIAFGKPDATDEEIENAAIWEMRPVRAWM